MSRCECGCGEQPNPGKRFVWGHQSKLRKRAEPRPVVNGTCPACRQSVVLRDDGSPGRHWLPHRNGTRSGERFRCSAGESGAPVALPPKGRRVTVTVDVVIPHDWSIPNYRGMAANLLRSQAAEGFVVSVDVGDVGEAS